MPEHALGKITPYLPNVQFLHPPNALSHGKEQQAKSHLSFGMCAFSPPDFSINVHFSAAARFNKITPFLRNVRFLADKFPDECALFRRNTQERALGKINPFLRYVHFFASSKRTLTRKKQEAKSHLSFGMCAFSPTNFPMNVHFFTATHSTQSSAKCARASS